MIARRLERLPVGVMLGHEIRVARGPVARALGFAWIRRDLAVGGLLLARCSSVHTFGMRFPLDLIFLDQSGLPLRIDRAVGPGKLRWCRGASAVLEVPSGAEIRRHPRGEKSRPAGH